jgi:cytochrome b subunit of formate dehydrogenase
MRRLLLTAALLLIATGAFGQMTQDECLGCHADETLAKEVDGKQVSVHVRPETFALSVHAPIECSGCHSDIQGYPHEPAPAKVDCAGCHTEAMEAWKTSIHAEALATRNPKAATCQSCHGNIHEVRPSTDPSSPTNHANETRTCGACHGVRMTMAPSGLSVEPFLNYRESVHGRAVAGGNQKAAVCSDCHKAHDVKTARPADSSINRFNIPATCGQCHTQESREFVASVHGTSLERGNSQAPTCTNCHGIHTIRGTDDPRSSVSAAAVATTTCSQCHESVKLSQEFNVPLTVESYESSYHGLAARFGSDTVANCASCHGVHSILPSSDPRSSIHKSNLNKTCGACHNGGSAHFATGSVHINLPTSQDPGTVGTRIVGYFYVPLIVLTIGLMLGHNALAWVRRSIIKRRRPDRVVVRMNRSQRIQHLVNLLSFFVLVITGFALAWPESWLAAALGDNEELRRWGHRIAAVAMMGVGLYHLGYMVGTAEGRQGLKDFWFRWKDLRDVGANLRYFLGRSSERPKFGRFSYAEKAEYWALIWGTFVMALTGLMIWFSVEVSQFLPRWWIDVATAVHFYEAILATLAIIVWHFYGVIFDPEVYPMNWSWWDGRMSEDEFKHEHEAAWEEWRRQQISRDQDTKDV